jgi:hypothetical protein
MRVPRNVRMPGTYFGQLDRRLVRVHHAHAERQRVANDEAERVDRGCKKQVVGQIERAPQAEDARVDAQGYEGVGEEQEDPF